MPETWSTDRKYVLETLTEIKDDVKGIVSDLNGEKGKLGLKSKVALMWRDVRVGRWVVGLIVAGLISAAVGGWVRGEMRVAERATSQPSVQQP